MESLLNVNFLLVPVIIACALGGTVGLLKLIRHFFPKAARIEGRAREWAEGYGAADKDKR